VTLLAAARAVLAREDASLSRDADAGPLPEAYRAHVERTEEAWRAMGNALADDTQDNPPAALSNAIRAVWDARRYQDGSSWPDPEQEGPLQAALEALRKVCE
jgi:hypothetical protein